MKWEKTHIGTVEGKFWSDSEKLYFCYKFRQQKLWLFGSKKHILINKVNLGIPDKNPGISGLYFFGKSREIPSREIPGLNPILSSLSMYVKKQAFLSISQRKNSLKGFWSQYINFFERKKGNWWKIYLLQ